MFSNNLFFIFTFSNIFNNLQISVKSFKRNPSNLSPETADVIQREIISSLRRGKDDFCCKFFSEFTTFQLPTGLFKDFISRNNQMFQLFYLFTFCNKLRNINRIITLKKFTKNISF